MYKYDNLYTLIFITVFLYGYVHCMYTSDDLY